MGHKFHKRVRKDWKDFQAFHPERSKELQEMAIEEIKSTVTSISFQRDAKTGAFVLDQKGKPIPQSFRHRGWKTFKKWIKLSQKLKWEVSNLDALPSMIPGVFDFGKISNRRVV